MSTKYTELGKRKRTVLPSDSDSYFHLCPLFLDEGEWWQSDILLDFRHTNWTFLLDGALFLWHVSRGWRYSVFCAVCDSIAVGNH